LYGRQCVQQHTGDDYVVASDIRETIRDVFGPSSPEFNEHRHLNICAGPMFMNMYDEAIIEGKEKGKVQAIGILRGLIRRLHEKRIDLQGEGAARAPRAYLRDLNLHPRIADVAMDLFMDGYPWEAVFAASKALVNYVKERSGCCDLDGAPLMRAVFSRNNPVLAFSELTNPTDLDEQEGMMHLFEGAVLGIRNPGGHAFPEGTEQRAAEYLQLLSLLAFRTQEATRRRPQS
jgi:uncharacterized protein (TIGR02391 family)